MPAKATLYNLKGEPTFDLGVGPRNEVTFILAEFLDTRLIIAVVLV